MTKEMIKGNHAVAETAIRVGLGAYFGYPITPQTELLELMSSRMTELGRAFVQAESELGAINMVFGAAASGVRAMTSSSGPGISLMAEGLSYIAGAEVPAVVVNVMRGGPGLGNISGAQSDYRQMTKGPGHGDYNNIVLTPSTVQECVDVTKKAFDLADQYRMISIILMDGNLGQLMEPAELPDMLPVRNIFPDYAVYGTVDGRKSRNVNSLYIEPPQTERMNLRLLQRWESVRKNEVWYRDYFLEDAEFVLYAFGTVGRIALSAVRLARSEGIKVGLFRPVIINPFPQEITVQVAKRVRGILVVEMNTGQMLDDVMLHSQKYTPVSFYGRSGAVIPTVKEILAEIRRISEDQYYASDDPRADWLNRITSKFEVS